MTDKKKIMAMVYLDSDLKKKVSEKSVKKFGIQKGFFSMAVREALEEWVNKER